MTNTGDFRRYSYNSDTNIALSYFEASRSSTAPRYNPTPSRDFRVREENSKKKSKRQLVIEQRETMAHAFVLVMSSILVIAMLVGAISTMAKKNELTREISAIETSLTVEQSENVRLNSELNSLVSMSMIDKYAVENLGMSKVAANQIRYIDVSQYKEERANAIAQLVEDSNK